jgi:hypothetical protein
MGSFLQSAYEFGIIPLLLILIYVIALTTPSDIIQNTIDWTKTNDRFFPGLAKFNLSFAIISIILGSIFMGIFGNLGAIALISIGIMIFGFLFATWQAEKNDLFIENVKNKINIKINFIGFIDNREKIENLLYFSRVLLFFGLEICAIGVILFHLDNLSPQSTNLFSILNEFQFRFLSITGLGYATMNFAWGIERYAIGLIQSNEILKAIKPMKIPLKIQ